MIPPADLATRAENATKRVETLADRLELLAAEMRADRDKEAERMAKLAKRVEALIGMED